MGLHARRHPLWRESASLLSEPATLPAKLPCTTPFPHYWAVMFLASVGFWNFLGAGVFGFLINLPIVSYYEIGTALTANHAHASFMGVYGMLSIGLALFCLRYIIPQKYWSDSAARISFWSLNLGLAWMVFATLFPLGILQLYHSISVSYYDARTLNHIGSRANSVLEWLRMPGDIVFILGGTLPILYLSFLGIRHMRVGMTMEETQRHAFHRRRGFCTGAVNDGAHLTRIRPDAGVRAPLRWSRFCCNGRRVMRIGDLSPSVPPGSLIMRTGTSGGARETSTFFRFSRIRPKESSSTVLLQWPVIPARARPLALIQIMDVRLSGKPSMG